MSRTHQRKQIAAWVDQGWPLHRMVDAAAELWKLPKRSLMEMLAEIREGHKQAYAIDRPEFLAQQMTRLEALAARAMEEGNLSVALAAFKELHSLARLTA